uniref:AGC-kinase C-terminal domain-containing protein n=1 Tax=Meloidogyne hapla TaxID=6305 RepID=A0A1I8B2C0_MELHA
MERRKVSNTDPFEAAEGMLRWNSDIIKDKEIKQFKGLKKPLKLSENQNDEYDVDPFEAVTDWLPLNKNVDKT